MNAQTEINTRLFENASELATMANNLPKPNKDKAMMIIERIALNDLDSMALQGAIAELYNHFMPSTPAKPKTAKDWILKAQSKNDVREYLNFRYVTESGHMVATDGHRLHVGYGEGEGMAPGFYDKAMNLVDLKGLRFPDWERVVPNSEGKMSMSLDQLGEPEIVKLDQKRPFDICYGYDLPFADSKVYFASKYITEALAYLKDKPHAEIQYSTEGTSFKSVLIKAGDLAAVIMPMRVNK